MIWAHSKRHDDDMYDGGNDDDARVDVDQGMYDGDGIMGGVGDDEMNDGGGDGW